MEQQYHLKVQDTNQEALASKISASRKGYFVDNFAEEFTPFKGKRDIIIHRGYWARIFVVRKLIQQMIQHGQNVQIVALGSGLDTVWFNLMDQGHISKKFRFIELDLQSVVKKKIRKINHSKKLAALFQKLKLDPVVSEHQHNLTLGADYTLTVCDLANLIDFKRVIQEHKIDPTVPTLFYSECVLSYIDADRVDQLMSFIKQSFSLAFVFDYQMYDPQDRFGQLMVKNFELRGCPLVGIYKYPKLINQHQRYTNSGFKRTEVYTMKQIYYDCIDKNQRLKIEKLQMLDELQEWVLIMSHYFGLLSVTYNSQGEKYPTFNQLLNSVTLKSIK